MPDISPGYYLPDQPELEVPMLMRTEILDDLICVGCIEVDGITLPIDDPRWSEELGQYFHPGCRADWVVIYAGIDPVTAMSTPEEIERAINAPMSIIEPMIVPNLGTDRLKTHVLTQEEIEEMMTPQDLIYRIFVEEEV